MSEAILRTRRWSRVEYESMIEKAVFRPDERLELLGGDLVVREPQGGPHALARLPEYWIANLVDRVLEVYSEPAPDAGAPYGWAYRTVLTLGPDDHVTPLAAPSAHILVADFLP